MALIKDCPTITVHAGKHCKALIDSGAAISLIRYSTYQFIDDSFITPIQPTNTQLNTADGSPMMALGMTALHLWIADFKFTHNFIICNRLPDSEIILALMYGRHFHYHMLGIKKRIATTKGWQIPHIHQKLQTEGNNRNCQINTQDTSQT